jgi:hypothetical protein
MATDSPLITRTRIFAAKAETTTGTAQTLASADGVFNVFDLDMVSDSSLTERQAQGSTSSLPGVPGAFGGKCAFKGEVWNGASTPGWLTLLTGCGFALNTGVYSTTSTPSTTFTLGKFEGGSRLKRLAGCMGDVTISGESGKPLSLDFSWMGKWCPPITQTIITPTYPAVSPPRFAGATITIGGVAYRINSFKLAMNNTCVLRQDVADNANSLNTGYHSAYITSRRPIISVDPEALALATIDWHAMYAAGTTAAFSLAVGTGTNGIITIAAPAIQLVSPPKDADRNGIHTEQLEFLCTSTTGADGEVTVTPS